MADMIDKIILLFVGAILAAALIPVAITQIFLANTSGWSPEVVTVWGVVSIIIVIAVVLLFIGIVKKGK